MNALITNRKISDIVEEYNEKLDGAETSIADFEKSCDDIQSAFCIGGTYVGPVISRHPGVGAANAKRLLLKSAWKYVYSLLSIERIATAKDRKDFELTLENPPEFTFDNIKSTFADYLLNSRFHVLRGVAEVFAGLDPAYKSHSKVKIGVKGLPKRVVIQSFNDVWGYTNSYGGERVKDILNAIRAYRGLPLISQAEFVTFKEVEIKGEGQNHGEAGVSLKVFKNGNAHVHFDEAAQRDINMALAEFYGEVLPDVEPQESQVRPSTEVSKDLQYYPTPVKVIEKILDRESLQLEGRYVLDPSCGCGRLLDSVQKRGALCVGVEYDAQRAQEARSKGYPVICENFLQWHVKDRFPVILMNPPFYGRHYLKHIRHAIESCLDEGGTLIAILPASAHYDHGELPKDGKWQDLPTGSFSESGTNVPTGYWIYRKG